MATRFLKVAPFAVALLVAACGARTTPPSCTPAISPTRDGPGELVWIPPGAVTVGSPDGVGYAEERPARTVEVDGFWIERTEVTNAQFARFVAATGYVTVAERTPPPPSGPAPPEMLKPGAAVFTPPAQQTSLADVTSWWRYTPGASWRHPRGPGSSIEGMDDAPVVQIAHEDAAAYARWAGRALPTEAQWERAARGAHADSAYAWGDAPYPEGQHRANTWQGVFPLQDTGDDGVIGVAPAGCFPPNDFGLYDMIGNVWEWTTTVYGDAPGRDGADAAFMTIKGGSFLCTPSFCGRFRPGARQPGDAGLGTSHIGFRTVKSAPGPT